MVKVTALVFLVLFLLLSCVNQKIEVPQDPENIVEYISVVERLDLNGDFSKGIKSKNLFFTGSPIVAVIKVLDINRKNRIQWFWFGPEKNLVQQSKPEVINGLEKYLEYFIAWDNLEQTITMEKPGSWQVIVKLDGNFLAGITFKVK